MGRLSDAAAAALKLLIQNRGLSGNSWDIAATLNTPVQTGTRSVPSPRWKILATLLARGKLLTIMTDTTHASAQAAKFFFNHPDFSTISLDDPACQGVIAALQADGLADADDVAAVIAVGQEPVYSTPARDDPAISVDVTQEDVEQALAS